jgi:hypothetical protein
MLKQRLTWALVNPLLNMVQNETQGDGDLDQFSDRCMHA